MPIRRPDRTALLVTAVLVAGGCVSDGGPDAPDAERPEPTTPISVTIPPERRTPFCQGMIDLSERSANADGADVEELIVETYRELLPVVPAEIADDFRVVLRSLETGVPPTAGPPVTQPDLPVGTDGDGGDIGPPDTAEYYFPATTPTQRVNDYVSFACQDSQNNPGPPPTEPLDDPDTTDDG